MHILYIIHTKKPTTENPTSDVYSQLFLAGWNSEDGLGIGDVKKEIVPKLSPVRNPGNLVVKKVRWKCIIHKQGYIWRDYNWTCIPLYGNDIQNDNDIHKL